MAACGAKNPCVREPDKWESHDDVSEDSATRPMLGWTRSHSSEEGTAADVPGAAWFTTAAPAKPAPSRTWFSTSREPSSDGQPPQRAGGGPTCSAVMLVCTVALALTTLVVMLCWILYVSVWPDAGDWQPPELPRPEMPELPVPAAMLGPKEKWFNFKPECGNVDKDVEYKVGKNFSDRLDHIPEWEMCCAMCHGIRDCESWVWKENEALEDGDPHSCFILGSVPSGRASLVVTKGVVSGLPPRRPPFLIEEFPDEEIRPVAVDTGEEDTAATLFCLALVLPEGYEKDFILFQQSLRTGIFGCDEFGVYSNVTVWVAPGVWTRDIGASLECELGGEFYTALNSYIFVALWRKVLRDGVFRSHDWTVKADADSVFFPQRLRRILLEHSSADYLNNCKYGLHGPIEVLHRRSLEALELDFNESADGLTPRRCHDELLPVLDQYGEDYWLDRCLSDTLALNREIDGRLLCEANCDCEDWYWCKNETEHVSYHPFKREDMYRQCMANTITSNEAEAWR